MCSKYEEGIYTIYINENEVCNCNNNDLADITDIAQNQRGHSDNDDDDLNNGLNFTIACTCGESKVFYLSFYTLYAYDYCGDCENLYVLTEISYQNIKLECKDKLSYAKYDCVYSKCEALKWTTYIYQFGYRQQCKYCLLYYFPYFIPIRFLNVNRQKSYFRRKNKRNLNHRRDLCEKCKILGKLCYTVKKF